MYVSVFQALERTIHRYYSGRGILRMILGACGNTVDVIPGHIGWERINHRNCRIEQYKEMTTKKAVCNYGEKNQIVAISEFGFVNS